MATPQRIVTEQGQLNTGGNSDPVVGGKREDSTSSDMGAAEGCVITPDDKEQLKESERQAWFQNAVNEKLKIPNGYFNVAVLVIRWAEDIDGFREGHNKEASHTNRRGATLIECRSSD